ncbi:MAG: UDP-N-acetylmuramoyl-L-alanine--D-glutamate ligase [Betaproteobacteria bacterium]|nr:UDP-N-acetylmuramoyl-L-alanine--D-glutamate ligase [Betaproteobacteria bacterium]NCA15576.1 UDP-N-acetylmuramoyl-L-alanine--D-glutamate ligase [Betaproteobacteria bacterium]
MGEPTDTVWAQRSALVLGAGESGLACAEWLARLGAKVRLADSRPLAGVSPPPGVDAEFGLGHPMPERLLSACDVLVLSPGLSPHPDRVHSVSHLVEVAHARDIPILGELDLFEEALQSLGSGAYGSPTRESDEPELALARPAVLAVTGTNGKTTTVKLTAHLLESVGLDVQIAGNVSPSMLRALMDRLDARRLPQVWVLELSSFQLASALRFTPTASVILNLTEDHLDWHRSMEDYRASKLRVYGLPLPVGLALVYRDDAQLEAAVRAHLARHSQRPVETISFGLSPCRESELGFGLYADGLEWMVRQMPTGDADPSAQQSRLTRLMPSAAMRLQGRHNLLNAMAALGLAQAVTDDLAGMLHGLRTYLGEPHRLQSIAAADGIEFVDDSKGTNVGATVAALEGDAVPVAIIVGGDGKGQSFAPLFEALQRRNAIVVGIGRDGPLIVEGARQRGLHAEMAEDMAGAVSIGFAALRARVGEGRGQLLLSPACASLDMFQNYAHRATVFAQAVSALLEREGVQA